ncbi:MAG: hypothetical protein NC120_11720 [Ruminococcus sp.]|nr:hypothetical protein [Ruminococcus sp.]
MLRQYGRKNVDDTGSLTETQAAEIPEEVFFTELSETPNEPKTVSEYKAAEDCGGVMYPVYWNGGFSYMDIDGKAC